jgi:catechol 2,3-dioxygenase-like lactoylglutathione lyase family enzyme
MAGTVYCTVGSNQLEEAKVFYDQLLAVIDMKPFFEQAHGGRIYASGGNLFGVLPPFDGGPATFGNGTMIGFAADSRAQVEAFHAKAIELGGTSEGPPGERGPAAYFAYVRDLDGNKLCAFKMG